MKKNTVENEKRLGEIRKEMAALGPVLFGDMSAKTQSYKKADGTVSRQKAQSLFRFARTGGKMTRRKMQASRDALEALQRCLRVRHPSGHPIKQLYGGMMLRNKITPPSALIRHSELTRSRAFVILS